MVKMIGMQEKSISVCITNLNLNEQCLHYEVIRVLVGL
jgi:hypothetical protein